jgi:uncharacterized glyoxalase superfamily protein PhnB
MVDRTLSPAGEGLSTTAAALGLVLWATDVPALAAFIARVAGVPVSEQHPGYAVIDLPGCSIAIHADEAYRGHPWFEALHREGAARGIGAELRLQARPDVQRAYREALAAGATTVYPPHDQDGLQECQLLGPDGYLFTLWSPSELGS